MNSFPRNETNSSKLIHLSRLQREISILRFINRASEMKILTAFKDRVIHTIEGQRSLTISEFLKAVCLPAAGQM